MSTRFAGIALAAPMTWKAVNDGVGCLLIQAAWCWYAALESRISTAREYQPNAPRSLARSEAFARRRIEHREAPRGRCSGLAGAAEGVHREEDRGRPRHRSRRVRADHSATGSNWGDRTAAGGRRECRREAASWSASSALSRSIVWRPRPSRMFSRGTPSSPPKRCPIISRFGRTSSLRRLRLAR